MDVEFCTLSSGTSARDVVVIRNISQQGMLVETARRDVDAGMVPGNAVEVLDLPLRLCGRGERVRARVAWVSGAQAGLVFEAALPVAEATLRALGYRPDSGCRRAPAA